MGIGCTIVLTGGQRLANGVNGSTVTATSGGGRQFFGWVLNGIKYTASWCPFASGSTFVLKSNGNVTMSPGTAGASIDIVP